MTLNELLKVLQRGTEGGLPVRLAIAPWHTAGGEMEILSVQFGPRETVIVGVLPPRATETILDQAGQDEGFRLLRDLAARLRELDPEFRERWEAAEEALRRPILPEGR
jgi:hypothetical protein